MPLCPYVPKMVRSYSDGIRQLCDDSLISFPFLVSNHTCRNAIAEGRLNLVKDLFVPAHEFCG